MDIYNSNWTESDIGNSTPAPDGAPEGMFPSGVNDTMRAMMGATKRYVDQQTPLVTGGTSTAYTLAYTVAPSQLFDGMTHLLQFNAANGVAATLNVNLLGAKPLHYYAAGDWRVAPSGLLGANQIARVAYNSGAGAYRLIDLQNKTGEVASYAGATAPAGALFCFGQAVSRTDYVGLFTAISTTYGTGDGSTTFNVPDLRGRVAAGQDNMGGSAAGRLTSATMNPDGNTLGATGGIETNTTASTFGAWGGAQTAQAGGSFNALTTASASSVSAKVVQPTIILNQIIKT